MKGKRKVIYYVCLSFSQQFNGEESGKEQGKSKVTQN